MGYRTVFIQEVRTYFQVRTGFWKVKVPSDVTDSQVEECLPMDTIHCKADSSPEYLEDSCDRRGEYIYHKIATVEDMFADGDEIGEAEIEYEDFKC